MNRYSGQPCPGTFNGEPSSPHSFAARCIAEIGRCALGNLAVVAFFSLSAFLLTYRARNEHRRYGRFSIAQFIRRRCLRIWPLYFVALGSALWAYSRPGIAAPIFGVSRLTWIWIKLHSWLYWGFVSNWSLTFNYMRGYVDPSPGPLRILWSVAVEEQFYLIYPFLIWAILRRPRNALPIAIVVSAISWTFRLVFARLPVDLPTMASAGGMYYATLPYGDVFVAGAFTGWMAAGGSRLKTSWEGDWGFGWIFLALALGRIWSSQLWYPYTHLGLILYSAIGLVFAGLIAWMARSDGHWWCRLLASAPLTFLGRISYGIYVWHIVANAILAHWLIRYWPLKFHSDAIVAACLALSLISTITFASCSYAFVERPFLRSNSR